MRARRPPAPLRLNTLEGGPDPGQTGRPVTRRLHAGSAEAVILQDEAEAVIRARGLAGAASWHHAADRWCDFFGLETCFRGPATTQSTRAAPPVDAILPRPGSVGGTDLLAYEWRSEKIGRHMDALDGLGSPAVQLDQLYAELAGRSTDHHAEAIRAS
jgi:hypothetical protein